MTRQSRRGVAQFNRIKFAPSRIAYTLKYIPTTSEVLAKAYQEVKANGPIIIDNSQMA